MNIQTEHTAQHTAKLVVEVDPERVRRAMEVAARRISQKANIPGFRRGKAPYAIVARYVGGQALLEESIEDLADSVYKEALTQSGVRAYSMGSLDDIDTEEAEPAPKLKLTFTVPKAPEVELGAYRDIRVPYAPEEVTDDQVNNTIQRIQEARAVIEPSSKPVQIGDKVKLNITGVMIHQHDSPHEHDDEEHEEHEETAAHEDTESGAEADSEVLAAHEHEHEHASEAHEEPIEDETETILHVGDQDSIMPGFSEQLVGMTDGEEREFALEYPADYEDKALAGHTAKLKVAVSDIRTVLLPSLSDDFAKQVTSDKIDNLLEYRIQVRKDLQDQISRRSDSVYFEDALTQMVQGATIKYPPVLLDEYIDEIIKELEENLKERGLSLENFLTVEKLDKAALRQNYSALAEQRALRSLALSKFIDQENISITDVDLEAEIDRMAAQFGEQAAMFKKLLESDQSRANVAMDLLQKGATKQLMAIARGENPVIEAREDEEPELETSAEPEPLKEAVVEVAREAAPELAQDAAPTIVSSEPDSKPAE